MLIYATHYPSSHSKFNELPVSPLVNYLIDWDCDFHVLYHPLGPQGATWIDSYVSGRLTARHRIRAIHSPSILRYIGDVAIGAFSLMRVSKTSMPYFIGADPLNALIGLILRKLGRVRKAVYYSVDYSPNRFSNRTLNRIYHYLDRLCAARSDFVWNVSSRITDMRSSLGVSDYRNLFVPNVPSTMAVSKFRNESRDINSIVTIGRLDEQQDYKGLIRAILTLLDDYPRLTLTIIGDGPLSGLLIDYVKEQRLDRVVRFTGFLSNEQALRAISRSGIGCALYSGAFQWNVYGDSMKCREYLALGLPILTNDTHSTVTDIREYGAGVICESDPISYADGLRSLLMGYEDYSSRAEQLGRLRASAQKEAIQRLMEC